MYTVMRIKTLLFSLFFLVATLSFSQAYSKKVVNWYNGKKMGMHTDLAYKKLLKGKTPQPVVVAVIDSGVDIEHEDLQGHIWTNEDEIPNNGIDDDNNGYVDDVHGWNFLGNANGDLVHHEQLEVTRLFAKYDSLFDGKGYGDLTEEEKPFFDLYKEVKEEVEQNIKDSEEQVKDYEKDLERFRKADKKMQEKCGGQYTFKDIKKLQKDPEYADAAASVALMWLYGFINFEEYKGAYDYWKVNLDYNYNPNVNVREIIGDDPSNFEEIGYGNNNVRGEGADHGTHVSGIICGIRGNGLGGDGVSDAALIMPIRAVPDGDERDKDIALAIRYAVDNGAEIINMSFGKSYSPYQDEVMAAFKYAEEKGVLVIHAAGNEAENNDEGKNFPTSMYKGMEKRFSNWIEVGASSRFQKYKLKKGYIDNWGLVTDFSNYGEKMVDVFAPGHDIVSTVPDNEYAMFDGTSMASPMVAGVAALLKSYYPYLTMMQIREVIVSSVQDLSDLDVIRPGARPKVVKLKELCVYGGVVNVYNACVMAEQLSGM